MSMISFEDFLEEFKRDLDVQTPNFEEVNLRELSEYDSMGKINASLLIEKLFGFQIDFEYLDAAVDLNDLYRECIKLSQANS